MATKKLAKLNLNEDIISSNDNLSSSIAKIEGQSNPLWGGHLARGTNELVQKMNSTISSDKRLFSVTIESLKAQLKMHAKRSIINSTGAENLVTNLEKLKKGILSGKITIDESSKNIYESIETYINDNHPENLNEFHICFSENSQSSGDLRLWVREAYHSLDSAVQNLQAALIDKAEENVKSILPGISNSQLSQPISLGHYLLAYATALGRDRSRITESRERMNESPYCSGEIAGSLFNYNREMVSRNLGFNKACANSIDAINSRDFAVEFLTVSNSIITNLSRLSEDLIRWHSSANNFVEFSNAFVTPSKVGPYRRDPEALEMIRAKSSKILGSLMTVATIAKSLPMEYSSDYREITEPVTNSYDTLLNSINTMSALIADFTINRKKMKEASSHSFSTAGDLVQWIIANVTPNYEYATNLSHKIIEYALDKNKKLSLLELDELQSLEPKITNDIYSVLIPSRAMIGRRSGNGSNPVQIRKAIRSARRKFI